MLPDLIREPEAPPLGTGAAEGRRGELEPKPTGVWRYPERMLEERLTEEPRGVSSEFRDMLDPVLFRLLLSCIKKLTAFRKMFAAILKNPFFLYYVHMSFFAPF